MNLVFGAILLIVGGIAWGGQLLSWVARAQAERLGLTEPADAVDPVYHADIRGEAAWDSLTLWALPLAGLLLILDSSLWAHFGIAGGSVYLYFAGRGIFTRRTMQQHGFRIGAESNVTTAYVALAVWGALGAITLVVAAVAIA